MIPVRGASKGVPRKKTRGIIEVAGRRVGPGHPCLLIAEVAQAHDGSLGTAHAYIDAVATAGADAIKFQTHIAAAESTRGEPWRVKFSPQDATGYDYWERMEFTEEQWVALREHADERGLIFLSSPFSIEAVDLLTRVGVPAWKVTSGEVTNAVMLDCMARTGIPILLSTGMSTLSEIDAAVRCVEERGASLAVFQCTTTYPCSPEQVGINLVPILRDRYAVPIGLSDHSGTIFPGLAAAATGIDAIEVHVVFSRESFGPDVRASVTTDHLRQLVEGVRFIETMNANPVDKDDIAEGFSDLRGMFTKSVVTTCDLEAGAVLEEDHLTLKKPGWGIDASRLPDLVGRRLARRLAADTLLAEEDLVS